MSLLGCNIFGFICNLHGKKKKKKSHKKSFTCWSACTMTRLLVVGWIAMAVGQELYMGTVQCSYPKENSLV